MSIRGPGQADPHRVFMLSERQDPCKELESRFDVSEVDFAVGVALHVWDESRRARGSNESRSSFFSSDRERTRAFTACPMWKAAHGSLKGEAVSSPSGANPSAVAP